MRQPSKRAIPVVLALSLGVLGAMIAVAQQTPGARDVTPSANAGTLPHADPPFKGVAHRTLAGSKPDFPQPVKPPKDAPNVLLVLVDDAGFGNPSTFGGPCQTPTLDRAGRPGPALQPVPRDGALLADAGRAALRPQPPRRGLRLDRGVRRRLAGLQRDLAEERRRRRAGPPGQRLLHRGLRQVAPDARQPAGAGRAVRPLAQWPGLRLLLGLPRRRVGQYDPVVTENNTIIGVPKRKDYYFPTDMANRAIAWIRDQKAQAPGQAVLHLLRPRRQPRAAPRAEGVGRPVQGEVRPGLGQAPRGDVRPAEGARA